MTKLLEDCESGRIVVGANSFGHVLRVFVESLVGMKHAESVENVGPVDWVSSSDQTPLFDVRKEESPDVKTSDVGNVDDRNCSQSPQSSVTQATTAIKLTSWDKGEKCVALVEE